MGWERVRFAGFVSDKQTVVADDSETYRYVINEDGNLRLEEVVVSYDAVLQNAGRFSLYINGRMVSDRIQSLSTNTGYGFANLHTWVYKGTTIEVIVQNTDATNDGEFQVLASIYEERYIPTELEKLQARVLELQLHQMRA